MKKFTTNSIKNNFIYRILSTLLVASFVFLQSFNVNGQQSISTLAGQFAGLTDGPANLGATIAKFNSPSDLVKDANGNIYVCDASNYKIRKIGVDGNVTTLAGGGVSNQTGYVDGNGTTARFGVLNGIVIDSDGNLFVSDIGNRRIRKITSNGDVTTFAGSGTNADVDGQGTAASFTTLNAIAIDANNNLYVSTNFNIRKITPQGLVSTFAGTGSSGSTDGASNIARFNYIMGLAFDNSGNLYVSDWLNFKIRKISTTGIVSTFAGTGSNGSANGTTSTATFSNLRDLHLDANGNIFIVDNNKLRKIDTDLNVTTFPTLPILNGSVRNVFADNLNDIFLSSTYGVHKITSDGYFQNIAVGQSTGSQDGLAIQASFSNPSALTLDNNGDYIIVDRGNNKIRKLTSSGTVSTFAGGGKLGNEFGLLDGSGINALFSTPNGIVKDANGNFFVTDANCRIRKITPSGDVTLFAGGGSNGTTTGTTDGTGTNALFSGITGITIDANNNLYLSSDAGNIRKITPEAVVTTLKTGLGNVTGITIDNLNNIFLTQYSPSTILKYSNTGVLSTYAGTGTQGSIDGILTSATFNYPRGIAVDTSGNLYVAEFGSSKIRFISKAGFVTTLAGSGSFGAVDGTNGSFTQPIGLVLDANRNVYVADYSGNSIRKVDVSSNANISSLTSDLTLSPSFSSSVTSYNVTAPFTATVINLNFVTEIRTSSIKVNGNFVPTKILSNFPLNVGNNLITIEVAAQDGVTKKTYQITVKREANANLSALVSSLGTSLTPSFNPDVLNYTLNVHNSVQSLQLKPTVSLASSTVTLNGSAITSGTFSSNINLNVGDNVVPIVVTNVDGVTTKTYTITIKRAAPNADLISIVCDPSYTLSPAFKTTDTSYSFNVGNAQTTILFRALLSDPTSTMKLNNVSLANNTNSASQPLLVGNNVFIFRVTAQDGITIKNYTVTVNRAASANNYLSALTASGVTFSFNSVTLSYSTSVPYSTNQTIITPTTQDNTATVTVNGIQVTSGTSSSAIALNEGNNTINVLVTAQNGSTRLYAVNITRFPPEVTLSSLSINVGTMSPSFNTYATYPFYTSVSNATSAITVTPTLTDAAGSLSTITINGESIANTATKNVALNYGVNTITTVVTGGNGTTTKTYTLIVNRGIDLSNLTASSGTFNNSFSFNTTSYNLTLASTTSSITLTPTLLDNASTVTVNGVATTSATASASISIPKGTTTAVPVVVTAADGITTKTYTVNVIRPLSPNANLSGLTVTGASGSLSPTTFSPNTITYSFSNVAFTVSSLNITPTLQDANASSLKINGTTVSSGSAQAVPLNVGSNSINVVVVAEDGTTTKTYTINVNRIAASTNANLSGLSLTSTPSTSISPFFNANTTSYTATVLFSVTSIRVTTTLSDSKSTMKVNGVSTANNSQSSPINLNVGINYIDIDVTAEDGSTKTYTITVTRSAASNVATLNGLSLSVGSLSPAFATGTTSYSSSVLFSTTSITVTPTRTNAYATIKVNGVNVTSGSPSSSINLNVGSNTITVVGTAENGTTTATYTITVTRNAAANVATLSGLTISAGTLSPTFSTATTSYTASVLFANSTINITPTRTNAYATIKVNGVNATSGSPSTVNLSVGSNTISVVVTAEDGTTTTTYTITVTRGVAETVSSLSAITTSPSFTLSPTFATATTSYSISVPNTTSTIRFTATRTSSLSTVVSINGISPITNFTLNVGVNTYNILVRAQDGVTTTTYTVTVTKAASTVATLSALQVNKGTLSPTFATATTSYTVNVATNDDSIKVTPTVTNVNSRVKVNNVAVVSGTSSKANYLHYGTNVINVVVKAQDSTTTQTYTINVVRPSNCTGIVWIGGTNNDWHTATNWCNGNIPTINDDVQIEAGYYQPQINADAKCKSLTVNSGATVINNNVLTINGDIAGAGTYTNGANSTLLIQGAVNVSTFNASASGNNVGYTSSANQTIKPVTYHNLNLAQDGNKSLASNITINGDLTISQNATFTGAVNVDLKGSLSANANQIEPTIIFSGTSTQVISSDAVAVSPTLNNMTINKPSGEVLLIRNMTINNQLSMLSGNFNVGDNSLTLLGLVSGEWANAQIIGTQGTVTATGTSGNVGGLGATITTTGTVTVTRGFAALGTNTFTRYYDITSTGEITAIEYLYNSSEVNGVTGDKTLYASINNGPLTKLTNVVSSGNILTWSGTDIFSSTSRKANLRVAAGGRVVIVGGSNSSPVPVTFASFSGTNHITHTSLVWKTSFEFNNDKFVIEASTDGVTFDEVGELKGNGNSNSINTYEFNLVNSTDNVVFYRIKQVDFDGKFTYSKIITVSNQLLGNEEFKLFPNPSLSSNVNFEFSNLESENVTISIKDLNEKELFTENVSLKGNGVNKISTIDLPTGIYFVFFTTASKVHIEKLVIH